MTNWHTFAYVAETKSRLCEQRSCVAGGRFDRPPSEPKDPFTGSVGWRATTKDSYLTREGPALTAIDIRATSKRFDSYEVFADLDLTVAENEFVSILGPSGCGKTTLLRLVAGLESASSGDVLVDGEPVTGPRPDMAVVFQNFRLLPWKTVEDNVAYGLRLRGQSRRDARESAEKYLEMVGLADSRRRYPYQLSGGMQQRVALARALAIQPRLLLMDEPFGALDAQTREQMQYELLELWTAFKKTVVFVTHSIDEAIVLSDRVILMQAKPGRIVRAFDIPYPRPRDPAAIRADPEFVALRSEMWSLLQSGDRAEKELTG